MPSLVLLLVSYNEPEIHRSSDFPLAWGFLVLLRLSPLIQAFTLGVGMSNWRHIFLARGISVSR